MEYQFKVNDLVRVVGKGGDDGIMHSFEVGQVVRIIDEDYDPDCPCYNCSDYKTYSLTQLVSPQHLKLIGRVLKFKK
jgi:hypothetical protein